MTQSISSDTSAETTKNKDLMELVAAEDAVNGEVSCGRVANGNFLAYLNNRSINIDDENFRSLLNSHLGHVLTERDFDSIISKVSGYIESVVAGVATVPTISTQHETEIVEHIPASELQQLLQVLSEFLQNGEEAQIIEYTHVIIHKAVLQPRHTWPHPIWVLKSGEKIYIAQSATLEEAVALIKVQHKDATGELEVVKVGGVLTPNQVIALDILQMVQNLT